MAPRWAGCSKEAYACVLSRFADVLANWGDSRRVRVRARSRVFPGSRPTRRGPVGALHHRHDQGRGQTHVMLPGLGRIKLHEPAPKLARLLVDGAARIPSATVRRQEGRWHVASPSKSNERRHPGPAGRGVGVDLGIRHLAVFSTGDPVANPRHLNAAARRRRRLSPPVSRRGGPDRRTRRRPSHRWQRANEAPTGRRTGSRSCAATASTSSPPAWPAPTAPSWSKT